MGVARSADRNPKFLHWNDPCLVRKLDLMAQTREGRAQ